MKRMGELMAEIGFNKDAPTSVKEAFIKHLIRAAEGVTVQTPSERVEVERHPEKVHTLRREPEQLSFFLDATGTESSPTKIRKP